VVYGVSVSLAVSVSVSVSVAEWSEGGRLMSLVCKRLHSFHLYPGADTRCMHPHRDGTGLLLAMAKLLMNQTRLLKERIASTCLSVCLSAVCVFLWDTCLMPCEQIK